MPAGFKLGLAAALILLIAVSAYFFAGGGTQDPLQPNNDSDGYYDPSASISPSDPSLTGRDDYSDVIPPPSTQRVDTSMLSARETVDASLPDHLRETDDTSRAFEVDEFDLGDPTQGSQARALTPVDQSLPDQVIPRESNGNPPAPTETLEERIAKARTILESSSQDTGKGDFRSTGRPDFGGQSRSQSRVEISTVPSRYTIRSGDSLWTIAEAHYGDGNLFRQIEAANPGLRPDRLQIGTNINLPAINRSGKPAATDEARVARREAIPVNARVATVREGDSLYRIAERVYGSGAHWRLIYEANRDVLPSPDRLKVGLTLVIPGDSPSGK